MIDRFAGAGCIAILLGFGLVAFYPFYPHPPNDVGWLANGDGLQFRRGGIIGPSGAGDDPTRPCSIEIWAQAARGYDGVLVDFFDPRRPNRLTIEQYDDLSLRVRQSDASTIRDLWAPPDIGQDRPALISVVSDGAQTRLYVDGILANASSELRASMADCSANFVLGSGASSDATWDGNLLGLAFYDETLEPAVIDRHHEAWRTGQGRTLSQAQGRDDPAPVALYLFDERSGNTVRDHSGAQRNLRIPESFEVPLSTFLAWPRWVEIRMNELDWSDIVINVSGFVPFGFFLCAFLRSKGLVGRRLVASTLAGGLAVSLAIEIIQFWLPTRTSSSIDVLTNALGAVIGALLYVVFQRRSARTG